MKTWLKKVKEFFRKQPQNEELKISEGKIKKYRLVEELKPREWEKQFSEYRFFEVKKDGEIITICTNFRDDVSEEKKKEIFRFVHEGFESGIDVMTIIMNVGTIFGFGVGTRGIPEEGKLLLFLNNEEQQKGTA